MCLSTETLKGHEKIYQYVSKATYLVVKATYYVALATY